MFTRLRAMLVKEFTQVLRDPKMRFIILFVPLVQVIVFGYAVNTDVRNIATALCDRDNTPASRELTAALVHSGYFQIIRIMERDQEAGALLDQGKVKVVLQINSGFAGLLAGGKRPSVQLLIDGTDPNTARIVLAQAVKIAGHYNRQIILRQTLRQGGQPAMGDPVELASRAWFNENLESRNYYVPGVAALLVMVTTMMLSSMAVVREKELGTMEQIIVTPILKWEFILGKTIPFALIGFTNLLAVTAIAVFWFRVPLRGSMLLLFVATTLYLLSTLGFGLLISTVSRTQQQAMMSSFMFTFPAMLLSGFAFPIDNMPPAIQVATYLNPLRYYLIIIRGIFLKGVGTFILWPQLAGLFLLGSTILTIAVLRFRKSVG
jgi:ABC-2 type transport system permease protein